jgi:hypothetical protein
MIECLSSDHQSQILEYTICIRIVKVRVVSTHCLDQKNLTIVQIFAAVKFG